MPCVIEVNGKIFAEVGPSPTHNQPFGEGFITYSGDSGNYLIVMDQLFRTIASYITGKNKETTSIIGSSEIHIYNK